MLSKVKQTIVHPIADYLKENATGKENGVNNKELRDFVFVKFGIELSNANVRFAIKLIRVNRIIKGLLAGKKGYYISNNITDVNNYVKSLESRVLKLKQVIGSFKLGYDEVLNPKKISEITDEDDDF